MNSKYLYQLYDLTAQMVTGPIMSFNRDGPAIREFNAVLTMKDTQPGRYPEQFTLLKIGSQDETTAAITAAPPETIATGKAWLDQQSVVTDVQHQLKLATS